MTLCSSLMYNQLRARNSGGRPIDLRQAGVVETLRGFGNNDPFPQETGKQRYSGWARLDGNKRIERGALCTETAKTLVRVALRRIVTNNNNDNNNPDSGMLLLSMK